VISWHLVLVDGNVPIASVLRVYAPKRAPTHRLLLVQAFRQACSVVAALDVKALLAMAAGTPVALPSIQKVYWPLPIALADSAKFCEGKTFMATLQAAAMARSEHPAYTTQVPLSISCW
jgi:hypothetical protein